MRIIGLGWLGNWWTGGASFILTLTLRKAETSLSFKSLQPEAA